MVKLRLRRMGRKRRPIYGIVATDSRSPRDGRYIEDLGRYNPIPEPASISLNEDRIVYWLKEGAQPSDTVRNILSSRGILLKLHLERKGASEEEIAEKLAAWKSNREANRKLKTTKEDRRRAAYKAEVEKATAEEAKIEKAKAEAEAKARAEADAARAAAQAEREAAQAAATEAAQAEQDAANAAAAAEDQATAEDTPAEA